VPRSGDYFRLICTIANFEFYEKKRPDQLEAVLRNLARYVEMLKAQTNPRLITANFIHTERRGLLALTQQGYKPKQPKTRPLHIPGNKFQKIIFDYDW
jgi:hypothetical protein